jgi:hypothetical protein
MAAALQECDLLPRFSFADGRHLERESCVEIGKNGMIEKIVTRRPAGFDEAREKLEYWLSRPVEERIAQVEVLRREYWGEDYETRYPLPRTRDAVKRIRD